MTHACRFASHRIHASHGGCGSRGGRGGVSLCVAMRVMFRASIAAELVDLGFVWVFSHIRLAMASPSRKRARVEALPLVAFVYVSVSVVARLSDGWVFGKGRGCGLGGALVVLVVVGWLVVVGGGLGGDRDDLRVCCRVEAPWRLWW